MTRPALVVAWVVAWSAVAVLVALSTEGWARAYDDLAVVLPWITAALLSLGEALRAGWGAVAVGLLLALGLAPLRLAAHAPALHRWLGLGVLHAGLSALVTCALLRAPFEELRAEVLGSRDEGELFLRGAGLLWLAWLGSSLALAWTWVRLAVDALRAPRDDGRAEALRLLVVAAVPAALASLAACSAVSALRPRAPHGLLVTPDVAAAGTAALVVVGLVVWLRLRLRAPETAPPRPEDPARV